MKKACFLYLSTKLSAILSVKNTYKKENVDVI